MRVTRRFYRQKPRRSGRAAVCKTTIPWRTDAEIHGGCRSQQRSSSSSPSSSSSSPVFHGGHRGMHRLLFCFLWLLSITGDNHSWFHGFMVALMKRNKATNVQFVNLPLSSSEHLPPSEEPPGPSSDSGSPSFSSSTFSSSLSSSLLRCRAAAPASSRRSP